MISMVPPRRPPETIDTNDPSQRFSKRRGRWVTRRPGVGARQRPSPAGAQLGPIGGSPRLVSPRSSPSRPPRGAGAASSRPIPHPSPGMGPVGSWDTVRGPILPGGVQQPLDPRIVTGNAPPAASPGGASLMQLLGQGDGGLMQLLQGSLPGGLLSMPRGADLPYGNIMDALLQAIRAQRTPAMQNLGSTGRAPMAMMR